jgi:hypothetical protein
VAGVEDPVFYNNNMSMGIPHHHQHHHQQQYPSTATSFIDPLAAPPNAVGGGGGGLVGMMGGGGSGIGGGSGYHTYYPTAQPADNLYPVNKKMLYSIYATQYILYTTFNILIYTDVLHSTFYILYCIDIILLIYYIPSKICVNGTTIYGNGFFRKNQNKANQQNGSFYKK